MSLNGIGQGVSGRFKRLKKTASATRPTTRPPPRRGLAKQGCCQQPWKPQQRPPRRGRQPPAHLGTEPGLATLQCRLRRRPIEMGRRQDVPGRAHQHHQAPTAPEVLRLLQLSVRDRTAAGETNGLTCRPRKKCPKSNTADSDATTTQSERWPAGGYDTKLFSIAPTPSISTRTLLPLARYRGGCSPMPTPDGVPVAMMSPG